MNSNIITLQEQIVKWVIPIDDTTDLQGIPDGVYPYNGLVDQWAVVVDERAVNWSCTYGVICLMHAEIMRTQREHAQRCPQDVIPFDGIAPETSDDRVDDYAVGVTL